MNEMPWFDYEPTERELEVQPHERVCDTCRLVGVAALPECGNCLGPSIHDKED